ncbi:MAG: DUF3877 family protein [Oscillospiraceae bacterium]|nr:DUF3877 family protein [Oscillospiraceae bacterium]
MSGENFTALKKNVIDVIKESQIKIGYTHNAVNLNYPLDSLNSLLGTNYNESEMCSALDAFAQYARDDLGEIRYSLDKDKYCLTVPAEGAEYVRENVRDSGFLTDFIALLTTRRNISIDDVLQVFHKYSDHVSCTEVGDDEFNYLIYFEDGYPDDYRYCVDIDLGHVTYHRVTAADYANFN